MALLKFKRSATPSKVPTTSDLSLGELAMNTYDGKLYMKKDDGTQAIVEIGAASGGGTWGSITGTLSDQTDLWNALSAKQDSATALTTTTSFGGDVSGTYNNIIVADDSHNHIISNVDGLQAALDLKAPLAAPDFAGEVYTSASQNAWAFRATTGASSNSSGLWFSGETARLLLRDSSGTIKTQLSADGSTANNQINGNPIFHDGYHPNADKWTTARTLSLTGDVTGSVSWDGSGNASLSATVVDDSHNHIIANVDGLQTALDGKADLAGDTFTGDVAISTGTLSVRPNTNGDDAIVARFGATTSGGYLAELWTDDANGDELRWHMNRWGATWKWTREESGYSEVDQMKLEGSGAAGASLYLYESAADGGAANVKISADTGTATYFNGGNVGIGTSLPAAKLHLSDTGPCELIIEADTDNVTETDNSRIIFKQDGGGVVGRAGYRSGSNSFEVINEYAENLYLGTSNSVDLTINSAGNITAAVDLRAPIFYDSNNTGYYVDPASLSALNNINAYGVTAIKNGSPLYIEASNGAYQRVDSRVDSTNYARAHWYGVTSTGGTSNFRHAWYNGSSYINVTTDATGVDFAGTLRSALLYDRDNTAYYVNPAATSVLSGADFDGIVRIVTGSVGPANTTDGLMFDGNYTNGQYRHRFRKRDDSGGIPLYLDYAAGTANSYTELMKFGPNTADGSYLTVYGIVATNTDMRSPIYYDSDNTGYYVDPAGTAKLNNVDANKLRRSNGTRAIDLDNSVYTQFLNPSGTIKLWLGNNDANYYNNANHYFRDSSSVTTFRVDGSGNAIATGSHRAPIFYDSNNTGYYVDPASTSNLNRLVLQPRIDNYYVGSVSGTGPVSDWQSLTNTTGQFVVSQFNNFGAGGFSNYPSGVYTYGAVLSWRTVNHSFQLYASHTGDLAYKTQWNNDNYSGWLTPVVYGRNAGSSSGKTIYGSILYDSDDTGYYVDPNGTSITNVMRGNAYQSLYGGGQPAARWDCSFYVLQSQHWYSHNGASTMYVGESGDFVYIRGYTQADGSSRAPIFYDSNNTGRYLDPASESVLNTVTFFGELNLSASGQTYVDHTGTIIFRNQSGYATSATLTTSGNFTATANVTAYSDIRVKDNVEQIGGALERLQAIRGVTYTRNDLEDKERRYAGVIAQEIEEVLPEAVFDNGDRKAVDYNATIGLLIEAIKELKAEVETLKKG